jgi:hypothetical protein
MNNNEMISAIRKGTDASDVIEAEVIALKNEGRMESNLAAEYAYALGNFQVKLASAFERIIYLENELNNKRK